MVRIFINGQEVTKEKLENIEIQSDEIKRILTDKLTTCK